MTTTIPATATILDPSALVSQVLPGFGVDPIAQCRFYSGGFNHTYQVIASSGDIYYLRAYRKQWRTLDDIRYELEMLEHLKHKNYPAAHPLIYHDGRPFCVVKASEGNRYLALFKGIPGDEVSYEHKPEEMALRYGQAEAEMHNALDDFSSLHLRFHLDLGHFIDMPLLHIQPFLSHRPADWAYLKGFAEELRGCILALPITELEQGACHGDLQGYHAKTSGDDILTFYDFDCGGYGYRAYDLAVFLWCCRLEEAVHARWEPFLEGYRSRRAISELDLRAVPLFVCARYLWHMGVHTQNAPDWGIGWLDDAYFDKHLGRVRQAEADYMLKGSR